MAAPVAIALRDGEEREVPARDLVPGDVVRLEAGAKVPADARITEAVNLKVDEAALTGESLPVTKTSDARGRCRSGGRRPKEHGLRRHGRDLRPRIGGRRRDRDAHGVRDDRPTAARRREPAHAPAGEPRPGGPGPGPSRPGRRRADRPSRHSPGPVVLGHGDLRDRPGRGGRPGSASRGRDDIPGPRRAADGEAQRAGAPAVGRGDAGQRLRHRLGQDRHADPRRDDRPPDLRRRAECGRLRSGLRAARRVLRGRPIDRAAAAAAGPAAGGCPRLGRQAQATRRRGGRLVRQGRSDGAGADRGGREGRPAQARARRWLSADGRDPVHVREQEDDHPASDTRGCCRLLEGRAGGHSRRVRSAAG